MWMRCSPQHDEHERIKRRLSHTGAAVKLQGGADVGGAKLAAALAHIGVEHLAPVIDARARQFEAERPGKSRFRPSGIGRAVTRGIAPCGAQRLAGVCCFQT